MKKRVLAATGVLSVGLLTAWWLYSRRPRERVVGQEGLDDPEVARGFARVARMPQMKLLRRYVAALPKTSPHRSTNEMIDAAMARKKKPVVWGVARAGEAIASQRDA